MSLATPERRELLALARASIDSTLSRASAVRELSPFTAAIRSAELKARRSSFVTLRRGAELRGCCGTLDAPRPLAEDVWRNAWAAAFNDYRFTPLTAAEWPHINLHLSLLTTPERIDVATEEELLAVLRPSIDGLTLEAENGRATFLPQVWEQIADPVEFVRQLKMKAGWPATYWSKTLRCSRYETESFGEDEESD